MKAMNKAKTNATETTSFGEGMGRLSNHEIWHQCHVCNWLFDRRLRGDVCPNCGTPIKEN